MNTIYKLSLSVFCLLLTGNMMAQCNPSLNLQFYGNANDISGNGKHGTVVNATLTADRFGNPNAAYKFNGSNTHISVPDDTSNDLSKTWTIMSWIKPDAGYGTFRDNHVTIVDKWGNAGPGLAAYGMSIHTNGELEGFTHTGSYGTYKFSKSIIQPNVWSHVVVTRSADDSIRLYINGILDNTYLSLLPQNSTFKLTIGMCGDPSIQAAYPSSYRYKGVIDDVVIYKCALTPSKFGLAITDERDYGVFVNVYPNPSSDMININQTISENYEVKIIDVNGKIVLSGINQSQFDMSAHKGLFIVQFTDLAKGFTVNKQVLVQ